MARFEKSHTSGTLILNELQPSSETLNKPDCTCRLSTESSLYMCVCNREFPVCVRLVAFASQIDGSTLRTLCMQHGPLITFHLNLPHGNAVVCYSSKDEAAKAQKSLHM